MCMYVPMRICECRHMPHTVCVGISEDNLGKQFSPTIFLLPFFFHMYLWV